jgi:hypothetical protein
MILVAATPIITTLATSAVATAPVWLPLTLIVGIVGFPIWIIVGAVVSTMVTCSLCIAGLTVVVVRSKMFQDGFQDLCLSPSGQFLLYQEVNPNVEPSKFAHLSHQLREYIMADPSRKLMASLAIDFVGNISFALPGLGEFADVFWAPISATLLSHLYSTSVPMAQYAGLVEEILPFTDIIPTATLAWCVELIYTYTIQYKMRIECHFILHNMHIG